jgi:NAD(P)-dependent dehydrogenase (short-subunit alcohol dehydrogenase family)
LGVGRCARNPGNDVSMDAAMTLTGLSVLVTGAAGALGSAVCREAASRGARVTAVDLRQAIDQPLCDLIQRTGGSVHRFDATDKDSWERLGPFLSDLDALITCTAVVDQLQPDGRLSRSEWDRVIASTLTGVWVACSTAIAHMRAHGRGGSIVNVGSVVASRGSSVSQPAYTSAKGGVLALSRELAVAHAADAIRVNVVSPGLLETSLTENLTVSPEELNDRLVHIPAGRLGTVADIVPVVLFLLERGAAYVTGADFAVDGGLSAAFVTGREQLAR